MNRRAFIKTATIAAGCAAGLQIGTDTQSLPAHEVSLDELSKPQNYLLARQVHVHKLKISDSHNFAPGMLITIGGADFIQNGTYRVSRIETDGVMCDLI